MDIIRTAKFYITIKGEVERFDTKFENYFFSHNKHDLNFNITEELKRLKKMINKLDKIKFIEFDLYDSNDESKKTILIYNCHEEKIEVDTIKKNETHTEETYCNFEEFKKVFFKELKKQFEIIVEDFKKLHSKKIFELLNVK